MNEQVLEDEYEFLTEEDMRTHDKPFSESLEAFSCMTPMGEGGHIDTEWYPWGIEKAFFLYKMSSSYILGLGLMEDKCVCIYIYIGVHMLA